MSDEPTEIWQDGTKVWRNSEGLIHRDGDLPAKIKSNGWCEWWVNGLRHRDNDLPAQIYSYNFCRWFQNGEFIKARECTKKEAEEYRKPYYQQKKLTKFNRFEKLIKE